MNRRINWIATITSGMAANLAPLSTAAEIGEGRDTITSRPIEACLAEVRTQADFSGASRVLHHVSEEIDRRAGGSRVRVRTTLFAQDNRAIKRFNAICTTGALSRIVGFEIGESVVF